MVLWDLYASVASAVRLPKPPGWLSARNTKATSGAALRLCSITAMKIGTESGYDYNIRVWWEELRDASSMVTKISTTLGTAEVFELLLLPLLGALTFIALVGGGKPPDTVCRNTGRFHRGATAPNAPPEESFIIQCRPRGADDDDD